MRASKRRYYKLVEELGWTVDTSYSHASHVRVTHPRVAQAVYLGTFNPTSLKECSALLRRMLRLASAEVGTAEPAPSRNPFPGYPKTTNKMRRQRKQNIPASHAPSGSFRAIFL